MESAGTIHIVDPSSRGRAQLARLAYDIGMHAELYDNCRELAERAPGDGFAILKEESDGPGCERVFEMLARRGCWLPVLAVSEEPAIERVIGAVKAGVMDYLPWPLSARALKQSLARVAREAAPLAEKRRRAIIAQRRIERLSKREHEVLDLLAEGMSNKLIARELGISPRTVEIHRHNMMEKLGCAHSAAAVRMSVEAGLDLSVQSTITPTGSLAHASPVPSGAPSAEPGFDSLQLN